MRSSATIWSRLLLAAAVLVAARCAGSSSAQPPNSASSGPAGGAPSSSGGIGGFCAKSAMMGRSTVAIECASGMCACKKDGVGVALCSIGEGPCAVSMVGDSVEIGCCAFSPDGVHVAMGGSADAGVDPGGQGTSAPDAGSRVGMPPSGPEPPPGVDLETCDAALSAGGSTYAVHCTAGVCTCSLDGAVSSRCSSVMDPCATDPGPPFMLGCCPVN